MSETNRPLSQEELQAARHRGQKRVNGRFVAIPPMDRFWSYVNKVPGACWQWTGPKSGAGYGYFTDKREKISAHRLSYEIAKGKIADGLVIDHLCRNTLCVNPDHLDAVSVKVNIIRGTSPSAKNSQKTHCKRGHPLSGSNLMSQAGYRQCRYCKVMRGRNRALSHRKQPLPVPEGSICPNQI
jgi:hypothetical protein